MLGQVTVALEIRQHAQDGHVLAALVGRGVAVHELVLHRGEHLGDQFVDDLVALHQDLRRVAVAGEQGVCRTGDALADQGEDLGEEPIDLMGFGDAWPQGLLGGQRHERLRLVDSVQFAPGLHLCGLGAGPEFERHGVTLPGAIEPFRRRESGRARPATRR